MDRQRKAAMTMIGGETLEAVSQVRGCRLQMYDKQENAVPFIMTRQDVVMC